jgi:hypothetical protein
LEVRHGERLFDGFLRLGAAENRRGFAVFEYFGHIVCRHGRINRDGYAAALPDRVKGVDPFRAVFGDDNHAVAGCCLQKGAAGHDPPDQLFVGNGAILKCDRCLC